ncbi:MAG: VWA domain-containing protein [Xanthomonadales bacterium]|nr:VWA domain-containing protein [Xanthomonadales bacterium]
MLSNTLRTICLALCLALSISHTGKAAPEPSTRNVDLVIALDVSGSMNGLIESAKQRLWDIVNDFGQATPQPVLRVAVLSYGNPGYGADTGFVRIDRPFTTDLDAVNQTLFSYQTNGGDEYVARAVHASVHQLDWNDSPDALRVIFVAGNEAATQDPIWSVDQVTRQALDRDIVVNAIYCGGPTDSDATSWQRVAQLTQGMYASIDQNAAALANIATPVDGEIARLNAELNNTYVAYGLKGRQRKENQLAQDQAVAAMSAPAAASRAVTKAGKLYDSRDWDLVDALGSGVALQDIPEEELPEPMQAMEDDEREAFVQQQTEKREDLKAQIGKLDRQRQQYIAEQRKRTGTDEGLDKAIQSGLRQVAEAKGFRFEDKN